MCLFVNERFINMPPSLVPTIHTTLKNDFKEIKKLNPDTFNRINCDFLIVTTSGSTEAEGGKSTDLDSIIYKKFEDY